MDELQAIQRTKRGDPAALTWLVEHHQLAALRTAYLIARERCTAEDVVQDVFLDLPDLLASFDETRPLKPWLMRVVVNRTLRLLNNEKRLVQLPDPLETEDWAMHWHDPLPGPESVLARRELEDELWQMMQQLSPEQRAAIVMRYYLQFSEQEMAQLADVPAGTIKWRLSSARSRLRRLFGVDPRKDLQ